MPRKRSRRSSAMDSSWSDVRRHLLGRSKEELVRLMLKRAQEDEELERQLLAEVAKQSGKPLRLAPFEAAFDNAVCEGKEHYSADESFDLTRGLDEVVDSYEELLKGGHATAVIRLVEKALVSMEYRMESVNDSYGNVGEVVDRLVALHHQACKVAPPDLEGLARWLFDWKHRSEWCILDKAPKSYEDVLGKQGLKFYATLTVHSKEDSGCPCGHRPGSGWLLDET